MSGTLDFQTRGGQHFALKPGDVLLAEDTEGGGHSWPGARQGVALDHLLGPSSQAVDTSAELWRFFAATVSP